MHMAVAVITLFMLWNAACLPQAVTAMSLNVQLVVLCQQGMHVLAAFGGRLLHRQHTSSCPARLPIAANAMPR
jgi:hypothetical protein